MSKISIVGVEGSGKTTLMAAFGEKYERPDENGYGLKAENEATFGHVKMLADRLRHGQWPGATATGTLTTLDWTLYRRTEHGRTDVCGVSFLDFAGEAYRFAFGTHAEEDMAANQAQIDALKSHIKSSDGLIVLVNLKDIIDGDLSSVRTREMMWVTQSLVDFAIKECQMPRVALAFSQVGLYRETIEAAGGLKGAYAKYLPHIEGIYPDLPLMALSAVDQTVVDADGYELPSPDFSSEGLGDLLQWIVDADAAVKAKVRRKRNRIIAAAGAVLGCVALVFGLCQYNAVQNERREREAWLARQAEEARQAELAKQAELAEQAKKARQAELAKQAELDRQAERVRQTELAIEKIRKGGSRPGEEVTIFLRGKVPMTFCWCPATTSEDWKKISGGDDFFWMGSPEDELGHQSDEKLHQVKLTKGFWLAQTPVTVLQYHYIIALGSWSPDKQDCPETGFSWDAARNHCGRLSIAMGNRLHFSLPTEAQWEYACRAGTRTALNSGLNLTTTDGVCPNLDEVGGDGSYVSVRQKKPNAWNLYDMHGQVSEWCQDEYGFDFYEKEEAKVDPCCSSGTYRVCRGRGYLHRAQDCRSASRSSQSSYKEESYIGFRPVCSAGPRK